MDSLPNRLSVAEVALYAGLTVTENINFYAVIYGPSTGETRDRKRDLIELMDLGPYLDRRGGRVSGSWKQRLASGKLQSREC